MIITEKVEKRFAYLPKWAWSPCNGKKFNFDYPIDNNICDPFRLQPIWWRWYELTTFTFIPDLPDPPWQPYTTEPHPWQVLDAWNGWGWKYRT